MDDGAQDRVEVAQCGEVTRGVEECGQFGLSFAVLIEGAPDIQRGLGCFLQQGALPG